MVPWEGAVMVLKPCLPLDAGKSQPRSGKGKKGALLRNEQGPAGRRDGGDARALRSFRLLRNCLPRSCPVSSAHPAPAAAASRQHGEGKAHRCPQAHRNPRQDQTHQHFLPLTRRLAWPTAWNAKLFRHFPCASVGRDPYGRPVLHERPRSLSEGGPQQRGGPGPGEVSRHSARGSRLKGEAWGHRGSVYLRSRTESLSNPKPILSLNNTRWLLRRRARSCDPLGPWLLPAGWGQEPSARRERGFERWPPAEVAARPAILAFSRAQWPSPLGGTVVTPR